MLGYHGNNFINGYLERKTGGKYEGELSVEGIDLSPIEGIYFKQKGVQYLWIKRKPLLEYDIKSEKFLERPREPRWEAYLQRQSGKAVSYKGEFALLRFRFKIEGVWDVVLGNDKQRLNFFVERLPMREQTIINNINERNKQSKNKML